MAHTDVNTRKAKIRRLHDVVDNDDDDIGTGTDAHSPNLEGMPDAVRTKILSEFIGVSAQHASTGAVHGDLPCLIRLASTSKNWQQWVYRETPGLWKNIGILVMVDLADDEENGFPAQAAAFEDVSTRLTDDMLSAFLRNIDAVHVTEMLDLCGCERLTGTGLEILRGSRTLKAIDVSFVPDYLESELPEEQLGILNDASIFETLKSMFDSEGRTSLTCVRMYNEHTQRTKWCSSIIRMIHKSYVRFHKSEPGRCDTCKLSKKVWFHSDFENAAVVRWHCSGCDEYPDDRCVFENCEKKCPDGKMCSKCDSVICASCNEKHGGFSECTQCGIVLCNDECIDKVTSHFQIKRCEGSCSAVACGYCRKQNRCVRCNKFYCFDCDPVKCCLNCDDKVCNDCTEKLGSSESYGCCSCGGIVCKSFDCLRSAFTSCDNCKRLYCAPAFGESKHDCPKVKCCDMVCARNVCELCAKEGIGPKIVTCALCGAFYCSDKEKCAEHHAKHCRDGKGSKYGGYPWRCHPGFNKLINF